MYNTTRNPLKRGRQVLRCEGVLEPLEPPWLHPCRCICQMSLNLRLDSEELNQVFKKYYSSYTSTIYILLLLLLLLFYNSYIYIYICFLEGHANLVCLFLLIDLFAPGHQTPWILVIHIRYLPSDLHRLVKMDQLSFHAVSNY